MKKIPKKFAPILTTALSSILMAFMMSGIVTAINLGGFPENYFPAWTNAFTKVVGIAFLVILIIRPIVEKIVKKITA